MKKYSIYIRVSTTRQGESHLGLEAQIKTCTDYITSVGGEVDEIFSDVQSGKSRNRKGLWDAITHCKSTGQTLVFAKLDRLARDVEFTFKVKNTGINIYFCDMPVCNTMVLGVFAAVAEYERELISCRTKAALKAKKARGCKLGRPKGCKADVKAIKAMSAAKLNNAKNNPHNIRFYQYLTMFEKREGRIKDADSVSAFVQELAALDFRTANGLPFNVTRAWNMIYKTRRIFSNVA